MYPVVAPAAKLVATLPGSTYAIAATNAGPSKGDIRDSPTGRFQRAGEAGARMTSKTA
ncbi:hypothetical protein GCM10023196_020060 [Actinoallomurus vinaceus]|uniref:Uncharacterized protein n=1 Tax=Actinoallomurus vinaceus TaxID=1080074 RepID=A0ABP8U875_9ACTN